MDGSLEERRKEENIPLKEMPEGKRKVDYQRTISSIKDPQVRIILLSNSCLIIIITNSKMHILFSWYIHIKLYRQLH